MTEPCEYCSRYTLRMRLCSLCSQRVYCSKSCQKLDWKNGHQATCNILQKLGATPKTIQMKRKNGKSFSLERSGNEPGVAKRRTYSLTLGKCRKKNRYMKVAHKGLLITDRLTGRSLVYKKKNNNSSSCISSPYVFPENNGANGLLANNNWRGLPFIIVPKKKKRVKFKASSNPRSLENARTIVTFAFPASSIIETMKTIPLEDSGTQGKEGNVLLAFISRPHHYTMRHCIYIEDTAGRELYVAFYLDEDNPCPYFSWEEVVPGRFICISDPTIHHFLDGSVGIRVDDASVIKIIDV